jgi:hypothetical protein
MRYHRPSTFVAVIATAAVSLIVAACGGSSPHHGTPSASNSGGHQTQAQTQQGLQDAIRFVSCLRSHGVTSVPDPTASSGRAFKGAMSRASQTPAGQSAYTACHHLLPGGGPHNQSAAPTQEQIAERLAFARCIRSHGFSRFPDPTSSGDISHQMLASAGIDLHQPALIHAADACTSVSHGQITRAMVARFVAGH